MIPYAAQFISKEDLALFAQIKYAVEYMRDPELGFDENGEKIILSCHMFARAAAQVFPVKARNGFFAGVYDHSWVETHNGNLIDVYPVAAVGGPIMFEGSPESPQSRIYTQLSAKKASRGRFSKNSFRRSIRRIVIAFREALNAS